MVEIGEVKMPGRAGGKSRKSRGKMLGKLKKKENVFLSHDLFPISINLLEFSLRVDGNVCNEIRANMFK